MSKTTLSRLVQSALLILCLLVISGINPVLADDLNNLNDKNISDLSIIKFSKDFHPESINLHCPPDICNISCTTNTEEILEGFAWYAVNATVTSTCNGPSPVINNDFDPNNFIEVDCNNNEFTIPNLKAYQNVTFTATDQCGDASACTILVVLTDHDAPTIIGDPYLTIRECDDLVQQQYDDWIQDNITNAMTAMDNCGEAVWTWTPASPNEGPWIDGYAITEVFFTATDDCGNATTKEVHFKLKNNFPPTWTSELPDIIVECVVGTEVFDTPEYIHSCGITTLDFEDETIPGANPNEFTIIRTWTVTDNCEGVNTISQTLIVNDITAPIPPAIIPSDMTIQCVEDIPSLPSLISMDNCRGAISSTPNIIMVPGTSPGNFTEVRTWTFDDGAGNITTITQNITIDDSAPPTPPIPPVDLTVSCEIDIPVLPTLIAIDNCNGEIIGVPTTTITSGTCDDDYILEVTWTFTDIRGNSSTTSQIISVKDDEAPTPPPAPNDVTVQCAGDIPAMVNLTASNNCEADITVSPIDQIIPGNCSNNFTIVRTWTFTDECGNSSAVSQNIIINDDIAPVPPNAPIEVNVQCADDLPVFMDLVATDNCNGNISASPTDEIIPGSCPNSFTVVRTWTFTDLCGNSDATSQTINVSDATPPVTPNAPANVTVQCPDDIPVPSDLTAVDNCDGNITIAPTDQILQGNCSNRLTVIRTWTFTDACGNSDAVSQTINVNDNTAPIAPPAPLDINIQCAADLPIATSLTANDNCDGDIIGTSSDEIISGTCANRFTVVRTWTFEDICGNRSTVSQNIIVNDDTNPVPPSAPAKIDVQCMADVPANINLEATDNCTGLISASPTDEITAGSCTNNFTIVRTWTFTDDCGNSSAVSQTINVNDDIAPVATPPLDVAVQCGTDVPASSDLVATDNCDGDITASPTEEMIPGNCINNFTIVRRWNFADVCGNTTTVSQTISVVDDGTPVGIAPPDVSVQCPGDIPNPIDLVATVNCNGTVTASPTDEMTPGSCPNNFTILRTWVFTDVCGNSAEVNQTITVNDNTAPIPPSAPMDMTVQCINDIPNPIDLVASDNCSGDIIATPTIVTTTGDCSNRFTVVRTWTFTDDCNNSSSVNQTITVNDDIAPVPPTVPMDMTVQCATDIPDPVDLIANDNCSGDISASPTMVSTPGNCPNSFTIVRTWTFTDDCDNSSTVNQTITVKDDTAPSAPTAPMDITVQCATDIPDPINLVAVDNCDGDVTGVVTNLTTPGNCPNNFVLVRTWTFEDACGNTSSSSQTFTVNDDTAPIAPTVPEDLNVQCAGEVPNPMDLVAIDNCDGDITASPIDVVTPGSCANRFTILRTWTFTDACGNSVAIDQTIHVNDDTPPIPPGVPAIINVKCDNGVPIPIDLVATDNCDGNIVASPVDEITAGDCINNFTIVRTWTFTDICGNSAAISQTIDVTDQSRPAWDQQPGDLDLNFDCAADVVLGATPTATDGCGEVTIELVSDDTTNMTCANEYVRTLLYKASDACGNEEETLFPLQIIIADDIAPTITFCPRDTNDVDLGTPCTEPYTFIATGTDNCGPVNFTYTRSDSVGIVYQGADASGLYPTGTVIVTYTATDDCGNTASCSNKIFIRDIKRPSLSLINGLEFEVGVNSPVVLTPDIFVNSKDDCSPTTVYFRGDNPNEIILDCDDLEGEAFAQIEIPISIIDTFENADNSLFAQIVLVNFDCPEAPLSNVSGQLITADDVGLEEAMVYVQGTGENHLFQSTSSGHYFMEDIPMYTDYTITPEYDDDLLNGVNTMDLVMLARHILLIDTLDSPYQLVAADVNNSGMVTAFDMVTLSRAILLIEDEFTNNTSWRFIDQEFEFPYSLNLMSVPPYPESISIENLSDIQRNLDFIAVKVGDLNNSADINSFAGNSDTRSEEVLTLTLEEELLEAGQEYVFEFKSKDFKQISGYQFTLNFDPATAEFIHVENLSETLQLTPERFGWTHLEKGMITTNWYDRSPKTIEDDQMVFSLKFKALANVPVSQIFSISSDKTKAEAYDETLKTMDIALKIGSDNHLEASSKRFKLHQNDPNPFSTETVISFEIPEEAPTVLSIVDINGKILKEFHGPFQKGYNEVKVKRSDLPGNSVFFYQLQSGLYRASQKMIMSRL